MIIQPVKIWPKGQVRQREYMPQPSSPVSPSHESSHEAPSQYHEAPASMSRNRPPANPSK